MRQFLLYIIAGLFLMLSACSERARIDVKTRQGVRNGQNDFTQILLLQGTQFYLTPGDAGLTYQYCLNLNKAGYNSRALKTCRHLITIGKVNTLYYELYRDILIKNLINPESDSLFQKYCFKSIQDQKRALGLIIDSIRVIDSSLARVPVSPGLHATRGRLLFMLSETVAADWDIQQCILNDGDYYNTARNNFYNDELKECWNNLNRYQLVVEKWKIPYLKDFPIIKNMVSQLLSIDTLLSRGYEKVPLLMKRAGIYLQAERYNQSIKNLDQIIVLDPSNYNSYAMRALARKKSGNDSSAIADLFKAEQLSGRRFPDLDKMIRERP